MSRGVIACMMMVLFGCGGRDSADRPGSADVTYAPTGGKGRSVQVEEASKGVQTLLGVVASRQELLECAVNEGAVKRMKQEHEYVELKLPGLVPVTIAGRERRDIMKALFLFRTAQADSDGITVLIGRTKWWSGVYYAPTGRDTALGAIRSLGLEPEG
jgi:hypothetical protein